MPLRLTPERFDNFYRQSMAGCAQVSNKFGSCRQAQPYLMYFVGRQWKNVARFQLRELIRGNLQTVKFSPRADVSLASFITL
jgi:hypothetical protein